MRKFFLHAAITLFLLWLSIVLLGPKIDEICVEGRLSAEQAEAVTSLKWNKCPKYRVNGCKVEEDDRILAASCSKFSRMIFLRD
jgi:hypothetical protein